MLALAETYAQPAMREAVRRGEGLDDNGNGTGGVVHLWRNGTMSAHHRQLVLGAPRPRAAGGGTDITRMPCSYRQCVTMVTEELRWLRGRDVERVMGGAIVEWLGWKRPAA